MGIKLLAIVMTLALLGSTVYGNEAENDLQDPFTIDQALNILEELRDTAQKNLDELQTNWKQAKEGLDQQLESATKSVENQEKQCKSLDDAEKKTEEDIEDTKKFIQWLQDQIQDKKDKLHELLVRRCEVNKVFIHGLKRDKIALSLLEFIKTAIQNKQSFSLAEKAEFNKHLASFLAAYSTNNVQFLLQMKDNAVDASQYNVDVDFSTKARTDEEIGTKHVDNNKEELDLDDFNSGKRKDWQLYKAELVEILDNLKAEIQQKIKNSIDDEINASVALANYKNTILHEIEQFERQLKKEVEDLANLEEKLPIDQQKVADCYKELNNLKAQQDAIESEIKLKQAEFDHKNASFKEEVDIFTEVIQSYQDAVSNNSQDFKERQDDYIEDGKFDNGKYDDRAVPKIDALHPEDKNGSLAITDKQ